MSRPVKQALVIGFWLIVWEVASLLIGNHLLLVGPVATLRSLLALVVSQSYWQSVARSLIRVVYGFSLSLGAGIAFAVLSYRWRWFYTLTLPVFTVIRAIPVASFVILAIFWVGSAGLSIFISFITVLPIIYFNSYSGLQHTAPTLLEMTQVLQVSRSKKIRYIYLPQLMPYLASAVVTGFGFAWKSGIAAELIGTAQHTIGFNLHMARIFLQTADLFAWTLTIVLLCYVLEQAFALAFRRFHD